MDMQLSKRAKTDQIYLAGPLKSVRPLTKVETVLLFVGNIPAVCYNGNGV